MSRPTITRDELVGIVDLASAGITESTREKLLKVAQTTPAVAVNWWHHDGVSCLARQAGRRNQRFQSEFDQTMARRFGRDAMGESFAVDVIEPGRKEQS